ncbi:MAG: Holliday junction resolvase RuvX [Planctomycetales bacterium]
MGIDFGTVRVGLALGERQCGLATPLETHVRKGKQADADRFQRLAEEEDVKLFVVGLPVHLSGQESEKSRQARNFGAWLEELTGIPVVFFDERFTTREAEQLLIDAKVPKKKRKDKLDMLAAQIMLQAYLDSDHPEEQARHGLDD